MRNCLGWQLVRKVMWLFLSQGRIIYFAAQPLHSTPSAMLSIEDPFKGGLCLSILPSGPIEHNMW